MFGLKSLLFKNDAPAHLPDDVRAALEAWRNRPAPTLDDFHFHTRYVIVDIASRGMDPESDPLLEIAASAVQRSTILPADALFIDLAATTDNEGPADGASLDRQLMAFLQFAGKAPLVTYHVSHVGGFLQRVFKERLGVDFQPQWIDLAWLLPSMFSDKGSSVMPLDHWISVFGLDAGSGRRSAMENTLLLARIFQMLLARASGKEIDTAARLIDESRASTFLRRTH